MCTLGSKPAASGCTASAQRARLLETCILAMLADEDKSNLEEWCEELAIHYSVDVSIPESFLFRLQHLHSPTVEILQILGLNTDDPDPPTLDIPHSNWLPHEKLPSPQPHSQYQKQQHSSQNYIDSKSQIALNQIFQRRFSAKSRRQSDAEHLLDNRLQVNLENHDFFAKTTRHTARKTQPRVETFRKRKSADQTIVLETPCKQTAISRSSTPGCSQKISKLSLNDC